MRQTSMFVPSVVMLFGTLTSWRPINRRSSQQEAVNTQKNPAAALMEAGMHVDLSGVASITIPGRLYDPTSAGGWVSEGAPIPVVRRSSRQGRSLNRESWRYRLASPAR
jgi:hypothetical protein